MSQIKSLPIIPVNASAIFVSNLFCSPSPNAQAYSCFAFPESRPGHRRSHHHLRARAGRRLHYAVHEPRYDGHIFRFSNCSD